MSRHLRLALSALLVAVVACAFTIGIASPALALPPKKMATGWYWPVGTDDFHGWDGFLKARGGSWHLAQDMPVPQGSPVYAIADGTIAESSPNSGYGGVLVVWHTTGDKQKFLAVYGHIIRMAGMNKGVKIKAGQVIGHVNNLDHCHFGIHPGSTYPADGNPYRGSSFVAGQTYGWTDPVKFLKTHPAFLSYTQPALPLVVKISTAGTPTVLGTANNAVYWSVCTSGTDTSPTVYYKPLPSGACATCSADATLPAFDTNRYCATTSTASFSLYDRQPVITASYSPRQPAWRHALTVSGTLENAAGKAFGGALVVVERKIGTGGYSSIAKGYTNASGAFSIPWVPPSTCYLRVRFVPSSTTYCSAKTSGVSVSVKPGLHVPDKITQGKGGNKMTFTGVLDARHAAGIGPVVLTVQQQNASGVWVTVATVTTKLGNFGTSSSRYTGSATLSDGPGRVRASIPEDKKHAAEVTAWKGFKVS